MRQRLEPRTETGFRPANALRNRTDTAPVERVEMEYPIRLPEPQGAEHEGFGLVCARHGLKSRFRVGRNRPGVSTVTQMMARIQMYSTRWCGYCVRAKALLEGKGLEYEEILLDDEPAFRRKLHELTGGWTVPQIVIDGSPIGGYTELWRLDKTGALDDRLAA
jgi:glutaredoxin 3